VHFLQLLFGDVLCALFFTLCGKCAEFVLCVHAETVVGSKYM
jgi:hypothetical protein